MDRISRLLGEYRRHEAQEPPRSDYPCPDCEGTGSDPDGLDWVTRQPYCCETCGGSGLDVAEYEYARSAWSLRRSEIDQQILDVEEAMGRAAA